jgi:hypothetical protein
MNRKLRQISVLAVLLVAAVAASAASAGKLPANLPTLNDSQLSPQFGALGGAAPLATDRTIAHWFGSFTDGSNGVTYGYNMVGVDPATNGSSTIPVDIIPLNISFDAFDGYAMNGTDVVSATVGSPLFTSNDYSSTTASSGGPGVLSPGNVGQLEDVTMRSQFNKVGTGYHLQLGTPTVWLPQLFHVPASQGTLSLSGRSVVLGLVSVDWFSSRIQNLINSLHLDPTHLPIFLTNNTMLYRGNDPFAPGACCIIGFHGASKAAGAGSGSESGNGNSVVQTFSFASYTTPGTFNPAGGFYIQDIHSLAHEIAEWGDDPFANNYVNPWLTPTAPLYGCTGILETGDPVVGIGFKVGTNPYFQAPSPNGGTYSDGGYHPEDEVFLPWFARTTPNTTSEATQHPSANIGRYTLMGDLNPYQGFRQPATGC